MSSHTLTYFGLAARGFPIRVALRKAGLLTEDKRLTFADWAVFEKSSLPLGQLPALEVDGKTYCQSVPLSAYAAKLAGLYPATPLEQLGALYLAVLLAFLLPAGSRRLPNSRRRGCGDCRRALEQGCDAGCRPGRFLVCTPPDTSRVPLQAARRRRMRRSGSHMPRKSRPSSSRPCLRAWATSRSSAATSLAGLTSGCTSTSRCSRAASSTSSPRTSSSRLLPPSPLTRSASRSRSCIRPAGLRSSY